MFFNHFRICLIIKDLLKLQFYTEESGGLLRGKSDFTPGKVPVYSE